MMIKSIFIGNIEEAYIYEGFENKINIIYSDDNNKGKTIVIQSIMYCLGNEPAFPTSFDYKNYYHILHVELDGKIIKICRKDKNFIIKKDNQYAFMDNISEFKRYWNKNIQELPVINKNGIPRIVDPELFLQIFFVGQDKKTTDNIVNKGFYNKKDFYKLLYSVAGVGSDNEIADIEEIKAKIKEKKHKKKLLLKENKILTENSDAIKTLSLTSDKYTLTKTLENIEQVSQKILDFKKERNIVASRKIKNEKVIKELRSLNRTINTGKIKCMNCGSEHISYQSANSEFSFDVSTVEIRNQILVGIEEKIDIYNEEIDRLNEQINTSQNELNSLMEVENVPIEALLIMKKEMEGSEEADKLLFKIEKELINLNLELNQSKIISNEEKEKTKKLIEDIVKKMNWFNKFVDSSRSEEYDDLFTKTNKIYSGSEATEFHLSRMFAFAKVLDHKYPIIVDSFRAEDLSSDREEKVLQIFKGVKKQVIFTTTLKKEEVNKYNKSNGFNNIDFSKHTTHKILSKHYLKKFLEELNEMMVTIK